MRRILFFLQSGVGGAERVTITIGKMLDLSRFRVTFCLICNASNCNAIGNFIPDSYEILYIQNNGVLQLTSRLLRIISERKPDAVFSSMMYINTKILAFAWMFPKTRFIIRNNNYLYTLSVFQRLTLKLTYKFADCVIAQTDEMRDELIRAIKLNPKKVVALQNPIDIETIDAKKDELSPYSKTDGHIYVASGRFYRVKGFDVLVDAFRKVLDVQPDSELYIVGKNTDNCVGYYGEIIKRIEKLCIGEHVHCEGFQTNPYKYVKNADCFVLSSRNEGLPNVLIESLYLGTPVAATNCIPVISRIVEEGKTGYLAETENPDSLAEAMLNAVKLGRVTSGYSSASEKDFIKLFE